ncbi:peroxisomal coenzyme A diphosphatase NUDT7-like [Hyperolius riggenbachi]|uniref:peroxisomal coenzyme A diphosphatase NUDT7-like n=1 Tax=Hyperolius riggenbachi TaxID=752182 RepID=UPI0035A32E35
MPATTSDGDHAEDQAGNELSLRKKIKNIISRYDVGSRYSNVPLQKASILLPLLIRQGRLYLLLTVRSMKLKNMPGDVCFPGGRWDPEDQDDVATAVRESEEEIGLSRSQVEIIGRLVPYITKSPVYLVTPVVGIVEDTFEPLPNPNEVTAVFYVPLDFFISTDHCTLLDLNMHPFGMFRMYRYIYQDAETRKDFNIWGLTANAALLLSVMLLEKGPSFDQEFDLEKRIQTSEKFILDYNNLSKL